jgi:hypothetical protein
MNSKNIPTRRTLIIRKPDSNSFERYKMDPRFAINKIAEEGAFKQFMSHNPLPYYIGEPVVQGGNFFTDFARGFQEGFSKTLDIGSQILPLIGLGYGDVEMKGCGKKAVKAKRGGARKKKVVEKSESEESEQEEIEHEIKENKQLNKIEKITKDMKKANKKILRGEMIRDLMKKHNMTLGQASRHIKENKLM